MKFKKVYHMPASASILSSVLVPTQWDFNLDSVTYIHNTHRTRISYMLGVLNNIESKVATKEKTCVTYYHVMLSGTTNILATFHHSPIRRIEHEDSMGFKCEQRNTYLY